MAEETNDGSTGNGEVAKEVVTFDSFKPRLYLAAPKASEAVLFHKSAFGAEEVKRVVHPKRKAEQELPLLLSAELSIGSSTFLVSDFIADDSLVKAPVSGYTFVLETSALDAAVAKAVNAGAVSEGDTVVDNDERVAKVNDPYGNVWLIASHIKEPIDVEA